MIFDEYLSIEISTKNIKLAWGLYSKPKLRIKGYSILDIPDGLVDNGRLIDSDKIFEIIKEEIDKRKIKAKKIIYTISSTHVITREVQLPKSTPKEVKMILDNEAKQFFPVDLKDYVNDHIILENVTTEEGAFTYVLLIAVPIKLVDEYMKIGNKLGRKVEGIEIPVNCVYKLISSNKKSDFINMDKDAADCALIDIGYSTVNINIFSNGILQSTRLLQEGFNGDVDDMIQAITRFIEFYYSINRKGEISNIYIYGGGSKIKGISDHIFNESDIPVRCLDLGNDISYHGDLTDFKDKFSFLVNVLGGLLR